MTNDLTSRHVIMLEMLSKGASVAEISEKTFFAPKTINVYKNLMTRPTVAPKCYQPQVDLLKKWILQSSPFSRAIAI